MPIIDSQVHVYEANTPARPWATTPNWPPHVNGDEMVAAMDAVGVDGGIFVSSFSMYQFDASYAIEVQRAHPGKFGLVKPINPDAPDIPDIIADWKATAGTVGVRIMLTHEPQRDPSHPGLAIIAREAGSSGHLTAPRACCARDGMGALGGSASSAGTRQARQRRDQSVGRLHPFQGRLSLWGHLGAASPRVRRLGHGSLPVGYGLDPRQRRSQL